MRKFAIGEDVTAINVQPLKGNDIAPPLEKQAKYKVKGIVLDSAGNQHLDVGLLSTYSYVSSHETKEHLPKGDAIHWCHPSRFE